MTKRQKYEETKRQKRQKDKRHSSKREFNIARSGQFCTLAMFLDIYGFKNAC